MMDAGLIDRIAAAVREIFSTMVMMDISMGPATDRGMDMHRASVTGMVGLAGTRRGVLAIHTPDAVAMAITANFLGAAVTAINDDVLDAIGEVSNMLGGSVKSILDEGGNGIQLSLPSIIYGEEYSFQQHTEYEVLSLPFSGAAGEFQVEIQLAREK